MNELNASMGLKELSMGMSADYEEAISHNATFVRIGSLIFGNRSRHQKTSFFNKKIFYIFTYFFDSAITIYCKQNTLFRIPFR